MINSSEKIKKLDSIVFNSHITTDERLIVYLYWIFEKYSSGTIQDEPKVR